MDTQRRGSVSWVQLGIACIMTAVASVGIQNTLLSGRVSVESELVFRDNLEKRLKDQHETFNRRLAFLEASDARMGDRLDKHLQADLEEFGEMDKRIRGAEIALARLSGRKSTSKQIMPNLHDALQRRVSKLDPFRLRIGGLQ